jgi:hypothetical protein
MDKHIGVKREGIHSWHVPRGHEKILTAIASIDAFGQTKGSIGYY